MDKFRRDGTPYPEGDAGLLEWASDMEDMTKKIVAQTILPNGLFVSTVWLGLNHRYGDGPPLIFETMVFGSRHEWNDLDQERYSTEAEALEGHLAMCTKHSTGEGESNEKKG